jgi:hypothetical protein
MRDSEDTSRIVAAGLLSGLAFVAEQEIDQAIWPHGYSDMKLLGMSVVRRSPQYWLVGLPFHLANSVAFALVYARLVGPRLPGPGWLRGLTMALAENTVLWFTLIPIANKAHPAIREGSMPRIRLTGVDLLVGMLRHVALGVVLGALCPTRARR